MPSQQGTKGGEMTGYWLSVLSELCQSSKVHKAATSLCTPLQGHLHTSSGVQGDTQFVTSTLVDHCRSCFQSPSGKDSGPYTLDVPFKVVEMSYCTRAVHIGQMSCKLCSHTVLGSSSGHPESWLCELGFRHLSCNNGFFVLLCILV